MHSRIWSALLVSLLAFECVHRSLAQELYWVDANLNSIKKVSVNGGSPQTVLSNDNFDYLAVDTAHQKLYYTTGADGCVLHRANLDGSASQALATFDRQNFIRGMSIDPVAGKIYWTSNDSLNASSNASGKVRRANLDGTNIQDLVTGMNYPYGAALDIAGGKIYWIRQESDVIQQANLDGSNVQSIVDLGPSSFAFSIVFSNRNNRIYWSDAGNGQIGRANADGSNVQMHAALAQSSLDSGVALNPMADIVFWGDTFNHAIYQSDLNGNAAHVFLGSGVNYPISMAVTPEPAIMGCAVLVFLAIGRGRESRR